MHHHLIIFAKQPRAGDAKTRLGAVIGPEAAAGVYARLLYSYLHGILRAGLSETTMELAVARPEDVPYFAHAYPELEVRAQSEGDLGARMAHAFERAFSEGADDVVLTGSDIPGLDAALIERAYRRLRAPAPGSSARGVVGPAADGGYYLIGLTAPCPRLFREVHWSTGRVLAETRSLAQQCGVTLIDLPELYDIDDGEDYRRWVQTVRCHAPFRQPRHPLDRTPG